MKLCIPEQGFPIDHKPFSMQLHNKAKLPHWDSLIYIALTFEPIIIFKTEQGVGCTYNTPYTIPKSGLYFKPLKPFQTILKILYLQTDVTSALQNMAKFKE